jgi:hypothetical protein
VPMGCGELTEECIDKTVTVACAGALSAADSATSRHTTAFGPFVEFQSRVPRRRSFPGMAGIQGLIVQHAEIFVKGILRRIIDS